MDNGHKIKFGIIGTNKITDNFLDAARTVEGFELKAVYSRTMERAKEYARKQGAELIFDSLDDLASCEEVDAVYVASPNCFHAAQSIQLMRGGKHVLCEKPIASNHAEFLQMKEAALTNHVVLLEAMRSIHSPGFKVIAESIQRLGTVRRVSFQYCQYSSRYDHYKQGIVENAFKPELSNGALMDIGVYCVNPCVALFGMPNRIQSSSLKLSNGVDGAGTILVEYEGMQGELIYSKISDSHVPSQIQGEEGTMIISEIPNPQKVEIHYRNGEIEVMEIPQIENNMCYEVAEFLRLIQEHQLEHAYLGYSDMELAIMDEVRKQQQIVFPTDADRVEVQKGQVHSERGQVHSEKGQVLL